MNIAYNRYLESLAHLKHVARTAPHTETGNAEYLAAYNACKAMYVKTHRSEQNRERMVRQRWYNCAILRDVLGKEYRRWEAAQQQRVQFEQRRYVQAMEKWFAVSRIRSLN